MPFGLKRRDAEGAESAEKEMRARGPEIELGRVKAPFHKRVAVVTGSAKGIGAGIVKVLLRHGWQVVVNGRSAGKASAGGIYVKADALTQSKKIIGAAVKKWGRLDLLVNNVGEFFETPVAAMKLEQWDALYDSNVRTALRCTREALPVMRKQKHGVIVNIGGTAISAARGNKRYAAYVMAKTALMIFTKSLAQAEAAGGIRVNIVNPGYIKTYAYSDADVKELTAAVPAKRLGRPEEIGELIAWLASDEASYVTGASIDIGGGLWV